MLDLGLSAPGNEFFELPIDRGQNLRPDETVGEIVHAEPFFMSVAADHSRSARIQYRFSSAVQHIRPTKTGDERASLVRILMVNTLE